MKRVILTLAILLSTNVLADNIGEVVTSHQAAAQAVLDATFAQDVIPQAMYQLKANFSHSVKDLPLKREHREIESQYRKQAFDLAEQRLNWDNIQPQFIELYTKTYNEQELKDIATFYHTETGKKYLKNMPATLRASSQLVQVHMRDIKNEFNQIVTQLELATGVQKSQFSNQSTNEHKH